MSKNIRKFYKDGRKAWALTHVSAVVGLEDYVKEHGGGGGGGEEQRIEALETKMTQAETDIGVLQAAYEGLTQSDIVVVQDHMDVTSPEPNTIYRETGVSSYQDWMYYNNDWYLMAEYDNAIDDVPTEGSNNLVKSGGVKTELDKKADKEELDSKANIDGSYDSMAVGIAKNLEGRKSVEDSFFERTTGGEAEVANGLAQFTELEGNSGVFTQLVDTNTTAVTTVSGHKYCTIISGISSIVTSTGNSIAVTGGTDQVFDLTLMFGSGSEPSTIEAFEQKLLEDYNMTLGEYIEYTQGKLVNVTFEGIESTGRNLLDPTTNKARILGIYSDDYDAYYGITGTYGTLTFVSDKGETTTITPDSEGKFLLEESGYLTVANPSDCCVFLWWDGSKTDYVENDKEVAYLDVKNIWGKAQGSDTLVQVWPDGMPKVNDTPDVLTTENGETVAKKYIGSRAYASGDESDNSVITDGSTTTYYILSTPVTLTDLVYKNSPYFADGTPVVLPMNYKVDNWGIERILPQNTSEEVVTAKPIISCKYSIDAVEDLDTLHTQIDNLDEKKPNKEGIYPDMVVGAAKALEGNTSVPAEYTFRKVDDSVSSGLAMFKQIKGKSLVWNQLINPVNNTAFGLSFTTQGNTVSITGVTTAKSGGLGMGGSIKFIGGHKYYVYLISNSDTLSALDFFTPTKAFAYNEKGIFLCTSDRERSYLVRCTFEEGITVNASYTYICHDLTLMFGEGKEPATVEEFEALYNKFPYDYNAGEIINNKTTAIESTGFNQWDEEWEALGAWSIQSKNFCPILPNTTYYCKCGNYTNDYYLNIAFYDKDKNLIRRGYYAGTTFTTPANAAYFTLVTNSATYVYGNVYNHDICINISNTTKNGTYEPHKKFTLDLNLPTATGKLNGEGESVVIFPDGMRGAGSAYDSLIVDEDGYARRAIVRLEKVDLGSLNWIYDTQGECFYTSSVTNCKGWIDAAKRANYISSKFVTVPYDRRTDNTLFTTWISTRKDIGVKSVSYGTDAVAFKTAMNGVELIYELAEPLEYVLDTPIYVGYQVRSGGTEKRLPEDTASEVTAPFACDVVYPLDAVGFINDANEKFINKESMTGFLSQLGTAMGGTWTMTWDATTQKYNFTFVSNS